MSAKIDRRGNFVGKPMTARQEEIHRYMLAYQRINGMPPTVREVVEFFEFGGPNAVKAHWRCMLKKGWLKTVGRGLSRNCLAVDPNRPDACPCCGRDATEGEA